MNSNLSRGVLVVWLILALCLSTCAPLEKEEPPAPVKLKVVQLTYLTFAPFFIAEEEGYWAEQGLEIELVKVEESAMGIVPLLQGDLDVLAGTITFGLLNAMAREGGVRFVADKGYVEPTGCANGGILARRSLLESGALASPEQMKGLHVAVNPAAARGYFLDKVLEKGGLTEDDIEIVDVSNPALLDAMAKATIDLVVTSEPWPTRLIQAGDADFWLSYQDIAPGFQLGYVAFGPSLLEENPDAGRRFIAAYLKAIRKFNEGKTERNLEILAQYTGMDEEFLQKACWPTFHADGSIDVQSVLEFQDWSLEKGYLDGLVPVEQFWDPSFIEAVGD
jgi:NitT/TauT family transport system substrate-binding protein